MNNFIDKNIPSEKTVTHYDVFNYWKDKCVDKYGNVYTEGTTNYDTTVAVVEDWGEPSCWACGLSAIDYSSMSESDEAKYIKALEDDSDFGLKNIYSRKDVKHNLQLAHIRAKSLQGNNEPSNILLLCPRCHRDSPDVSNKRMILSWLFKRRKEGTVAIRCMYKATDILKKDYQINVAPGLFDFNEAFQRNAITCHGSVMVEDSITYALVQNALQRKIELNKENEKMFIKIIEETIKSIKSNYNITNAQYTDIDNARIETLQTILHLYESLKMLERVK